MQSRDSVVVVDDSIEEGLLAPGTLIKGYRISGVIRSGKSNNVYSGWSPTGSEVAIKEYFPRRLAKRMPSGRLGVANEKIKRMFETGVRGFINEAIILAEIKSDLLAQYVTAFRENGTAYLVTALEPGETLEFWVRGIVKEGRRPKEGDLRFIFWALLNAVQVMHDLGFLHLDIKPSNVMMRDVDTPILIDLGGARRFPYGEVEEMSASNFTPGFAAPEQHAEQLHLFDPSTDIYGIGASILYCMTGKVPPLASERVVRDTIDDLFRRSQEHYSPQLIAIVKGCLLVSQSERFSSIPDLQNLISMH